MTGKDTKECDEFVCSKCGIHLMEWVEVRIDEDYDETNCGAKIKVVE